MAVTSQLLVKKAAGEIIGLQWTKIDFDNRVAHLEEKRDDNQSYKTKTGKKRKAPLSIEAIRILRHLESVKKDDRVFGLNSSMLDALFRKAKDKALIKDLHFHDTRAEAITRLADKFVRSGEQKGLDILDLAIMTGYGDLKSLKIYYRKPASEIAKRLD